MPTSSTELNRLLKSEPDLVDRMFEYILSDPELVAAISKIGGNKTNQVDALKASVRAEFKGETVYVASRRALTDSVLALFNGRNATEVARRLQISRATVYRHLKQAGPTKIPSHISGK